MIISLTGFMGCGKSSVGRELATLLGCTAVDLDGVIEQRSGRKIPEIFESDGEAAFRKLELEALREVLGMEIDCPAVKVSQSDGSKINVTSNSSENSLSKIGETETKNISDESCGKIEKNGINLILSLGGGTLTTPECAELIHEKTVCIYLRASINTLVENLEEDGTSNRPMLNGNSLRNRITELMSARKDSYEKTAHHIIDIDGETPLETATRIVKLLG